MEEVDQIIVHSLRTLGCDIEDGFDNLKQFSTELIISATVKCLKTINNATDLPSSLPPGMSARYRIGTTLAHCIQEMGYRGEIGYQTFLYSNENEIRKVFMFLIEKMPKEAVGSTEEPLGASDLLQRSIAATVARQLTCPWVPSYLRQNDITWRGKPATWQRESVITENSTKASKLPCVTNQTLRHCDTTASAIETNAAEVTLQHEWENEWNQASLTSHVTEQDYRLKKRQKIQKRISEQIHRGLQHGDVAKPSTTQSLAHIINSIANRTSGTVKTKGSRFSHTEKLQFTKSEEKILQIGGEGPTIDSEEELKKKQESEVESLQNELSSLSSQVDSLEVDTKKFAAGIQHTEEHISIENQKISEEQQKYRVKKQTIDLLPDAENNIAKLQSVVDNSSQRLVNLASQWEKHRVPLIEQHRDLRLLNSHRESEAQKKVEEVKNFRVKMKEIAEDTRAKEDLYKQLVSEYERMAKDANRSAYTRRIMEIVSNIKKQKMEIDKVLMDTRTLQKEINLLSGKLDRTFTVTDELIFRDAKKDEAVRKAYKYLAALHENCEALIKTLEETGVIMREIRDLEDQIENESNNKVLANLEKISSDYKQMKEENAALLAKLKEKQ